MTVPDPHAVLRALGMVNVVAVTPLASNRGKGVWRVEGPDGVFALRVLRAHEHTTADRERSAMDAALSAGLEVPDVRAIGEWENHPAMLLSWCPGRTVQAELHVRPWAAYRLGLECGRWQAALHRVHADAAIESWVDYFGVVDPSMRERLLRVSQATPRLLHLDYHLQNIVVRAGVVTGVVDWTNATSGDPRADVARTWALLSVFPGSRTLAARVGAAVRHVFAAGWQRGYANLAGRQTDMPLFRAWALVGLLSRARRGTEGSGKRHDLFPLQALASHWRARAGLPREAV
ncbi:hypothetical protein BH23GEM2_BH23GEM2_11890 [soil metagenome]